MSNALFRCDRPLIYHSIVKLWIVFLLIPLTSSAKQYPSIAPSDLNDVCWRETFSDEFDALSLWNSKSGEGIWRTQYIWNRDIIINNELQYYVDPRLHPHDPFDIQMAGGSTVLHIIATSLDADDPLSAKSQYVSGLLTTEKSFRQKYGRFEARLKMPKGKGLWPAFWLLPSFERWPSGVDILPEIDVMEYLGHQPKSYHTTLHTNQTGKLTSHPYHHTLMVDLTEDFHDYAVVWNEQSVSWYFDGKRVSEHPTPVDFTRPVHFLLNLAIGGWAGEPDRNTQFPAVYQIDYVKAYTWCDD